MHSSLPILKIRKKSDYSRLLKSDIKVQSVSWILIAEQMEHGNLGVGIIASKKLGNAVMRNRAKRRIRALCHEVLTNESDLVNVNMVLIAKVNLLRRNYQLLKRELKYCVAELLKQLHNSGINYAS